MADKIWREKIYLGGITPDDVKMGPGAIPCNIVDEFIAEIRNARSRMDMEWRPAGWKDSGRITEENGHEVHRMEYHVAVWSPRIDPRVRLEIILCPDRNYVILGKRELIAFGLGGNRTKSDEYATFQSKLEAAIENGFLKAKKRHARWEEKQASRTARTREAQSESLSPDVSERDRVVKTQGIESVVRKMKEYYRDCAPETAKQILQGLPTAYTTYKANKRKTKRGRWGPKFVSENLDLYLASAVMSKYLGALCKVVGTQWRGVPIPHRQKPQEHHKT